MCVTVATLPTVPALLPGPFHLEGGGRAGGASRSFAAPVPAARPLCGNRHAACAAALHCVLALTGSATPCEWDPLAGFRPGTAGHVNDLLCGCRVRCRTRAPRRLPRHPFPTGVVHAAWHAQSLSCLASQPLTTMHSQSKAPNTPYAHSNRTQVIIPSAQPGRDGSST